ncbi:MAG: lactate utilization protein [Rhodospirillales bacterium 20-60-12]|nr:MAG: lactate utilization protein [Rhodospirillales bacterium 20-60-12]HQT68733.1 LUD domain-containing protein [Acetobacteraceae bacterium]
MSDKAAILGAIRRGLRRGPLPADQMAMLDSRTAAHPRHIIPARGQLPPAGRVALFMKYIERDYGSSARLPDMAAIPAAIAAYLAGQNLPAALAYAPHPDFLALDWSTAPMLRIRAGEAIGSDMVALQRGFAGIAETGTLMLPSGSTTPTTLNLLADTAIVVIQAREIVGFYEEAFDLLRQAGPMPRNVMLVTGPSRSADIEQTLELGAHGPRQLHVLIIGDEEATRQAA